MAQFLAFLIYSSLVTLFSFLLVSGDQTNVHELSQATYIVQVQNDLKPSNYATVLDWYSSTLKSLKASTTTNFTISHTLLKTEEVDFLYLYTAVFQGFSAKLTRQQALELEKLPQILGVFQDQVRQLHTTRSPEFLGLVARTQPNGLLKESDWGSNVTIGVIDSGVWPERRSFHDKDLGPVPPHWRGECVAGDQFPKTLCNKKLIGARYYYSGHLAHFGDRKKLIKSARDDVGHGTHTASTAAGRRVENASFFGFARGVSHGIAPKARLAVYKACWEDGCSESDILAGIDDAVRDGVDVISISIGGQPTTYDDDVISIASFGATRSGIVVSASGGNSGPTLGTVSNVAPWMTTVGAGTLDRKFPAEVVLGDGTVLTGSSLYSGKPFPAGKTFPVIYAGNATDLERRPAANDSDYYSELCVPGWLDAELVKGKIVVCDVGVIPIPAKGVVVKEAGGVGVIVANVAPFGEGLIAEAFLTPGVWITESARDKVLSYTIVSENPRATMRFKGTKLGAKPAPMVSFFSSRGPNSVSPYLLKPDLIAPGVDILAAWPDYIPPTWLSEDPRRTQFNIISGTSMSCPHVSGISALLKGVHPDWTPAMIKSAMMTTAYMDDRDGKPMRDERNHRTATVWEAGAGHVDPEKAVDPGLVYDITVDDYVSFLCASNYSNQRIKVVTGKEVDCKKSKVMNTWELNYPAIVVPLSASGPSKLEVSVPRTVTCVSEGVRSYTVEITKPEGVTVRVVPEKMVFEKKGDKQSYVVKILADDHKRRGSSGTSEFGLLTWTDRKHRATSPLVVTWVN
ncbi:Subtilase [Parasponia andersonii]|uniref:Subtilase n=1 Tax=Parasponia andersonii TaxID=3476 RepID=A0A2P5AVE0_PARAD|nr:Subtilase [Parasponia andersonii]